MDRAAAINLVHGLVAIPSLSRQEAVASAWLAAQMRGAGFDRAYVDEAGNAVGELGDPNAPRTIVLLGHIDTVPGNIPVRIEDDRLYGRGSVDAKGPLAAFVAGAARFGSQAAKAASLRTIVVGAVEEEAATSKGARFIAARFNGTNESIPTACIIGEPSHWNRVTLGYKGRLLMDFTADQPMAHTAGPDASVASVVVDYWNWVTAHAAKLNDGKDKVFDQLSPSLRRFITSTNDQMHDTVDGQFAWRLPVGFDVEAFMRELEAQANRPSGQQAIRTKFDLKFRGYEKAWRGDRSNALVRSFLSGLRAVQSEEKLGFVLKTGTSDMNVVGPVWQCPIVAYGPGDSALDHTPNEHLSIDEYWKGFADEERRRGHLELYRSGDFAKLAEYDLASLGVPVLLVWGESDDRLGSVPSAAAGLTTARQLTVSARHTWVPSPTMVVEARFSSARHENEQGVDEAIVGRDLRDFGARWSPAIADGARYLPNVEILDGMTLGSVGRNGNGHGGALSHHHSPNASSLVRSLPAGAAAARGL